MIALADPIVIPSWVWGVIGSLLLLAWGTVMGLVRWLGERAIKKIDEHLTGLDTRIKELSEKLSAKIDNIEEKHREDLAALRDELAGVREDLAKGLRAEDEARHKLRGEMQLPLLQVGTVAAETKVLHEKLAGIERRLALLEK